MIDARLANPQRKSLTKQEVLAIHRDVFYQALLKNDLEALSRLYSDNYMLVRPDGSVLNRDEILHDLRESGLTFKSIELKGEQVRVYGETGILTGESRTISERNGVSNPTQFRFIAVYAQIGEALRLIHFQSTSLIESDWPAVLTQEATSTFGA